MAIDAGSEVIIPLVDASDLMVEMGLPRARAESLRRWATAGVRGVRLDVLIFGGRYFTSKRAVEDFVAAGSPPVRSGR